MRPQLVEGAEAKAYYGLALNYGPLRALVNRLLVKETMTGKEVIETLEGAGLVRFPDPYVAGFGWSPGGGLVYPGMSEEVPHSFLSAALLIIQPSLSGFSL
jgi:cell division protease FtsH